MHRKRFFTFEMVAALFLLFAVGAVAYLSSFAPNQMGHSAGEVQLLFSTYTTDCSGDSEGVACQASCQNPGEMAVTGNCISDLGYSFGAWGITDAATGQQVWECSDASHAKGPRLYAQVVCLHTGAP